MRFKYYVKRWKRRKRNAYMHFVTLYRKKICQEFKMRKSIATKVSKLTDLISLIIVRQCQDHTHRSSQSGKNMIFFLLGNLLAVYM